MFKEKDKKNCTPFGNFLVSGIVACGISHQAGGGGGVDR